MHTSEEGRGSVKTLLLFLFIAAFAGVTRAQPERARPEPELLERARELARRILIVDTHIDLPGVLQDKWQDISMRTTGGDFDYVRAKEGGLTVAFMSIYTPSALEGTGRSKAAADALIDTVQNIAVRWPAKFSIVTSVNDVLTQQSSGRILLALGMENGSPIERKLENIAYFYRRGIRYITLAHAKSNHICDSSYDPKRTWNGLSPFGRGVVEEMNRLGIMIDVSHTTDSTFFQVLQLSKAPVIASHSSCRYFTPGFERNMSDTMIRALAAKGGVIQISFGSSFIDNDIRLQSEKGEQAIDEHLRRHHLKPGDKEARTFTEKYRYDHPPRFAGVKEVAAHIDHVVQLVGFDYVGLGSDFDGVGDTLPAGLKDVSQYPNLICELLKLGYPESAIAKICSGNLLRVWSAVETAAR